MIDPDCAGGKCLRFESSGERYCAEPCSASDPCGGSYQCSIPAGMLEGNCVPPAEFGGTCYP